MKNKFKFALITSATILMGLTSCGQVSSSLPNQNKCVLGVSLNYESIELEIEHGFLMVATIEYSEDIKDYNLVSKEWISSDPTIASVDATGFVTGISSGYAYISYIVGYKMATCEVHVKGDEPTPPTPPSEFTITLNTSKKNLTVGQSFTLVATTSKPVSIMWSSSDDTVASVDSYGNVNALKEGTVTITASANDKQASCTVVVSKKKYDCTVYFYIDYNNIDYADTTGTRLLASFQWYFNEPLINSGLVPKDPTTAMDPAFPYFLGWSSHTIIDDLSDLWDMSKDVITTDKNMYFYGIWSDVPRSK